jgi:hypothetical protein
MTIQELIDLKNANLAAIEDLKKIDEEYTHNIAAMLLEAGEKQAYGSDGLGFQLFTTTRYEFGKAAYIFMEQKGLLDRFIGEPKITKTKIDALMKDGELTYADMAEIEKWMDIQQSPYSLKKVVDKKAVVA